MVEKDDLEGMTGEACAIVRRSVTARSSSSLAARPVGGASESTHVPSHDAERSIPQHALHKQARRDGFKAPAEFRIRDPTRERNGAEP